MQRTDEEHYTALEELAADLPIKVVTVDPSAASFIECIKRHGKFSVTRADNDVIDGIRRTADLLAADKLRISKKCTAFFSEITEYSWADSLSDRPRKENDHAMDDMRYFVGEITQIEQPFFVASLDRNVYKF